MLPKRLQSEMMTQWVYGLYTSGICYPRGYKVKWLNSEFMVCIGYSGICYPRGYKVKWYNTVSLWFVYLRYMLPKRLQSEMIKHEFMVCIPQVYATQEVTKWNGVYGLYTSEICYPRGYKVKWLHSDFMATKWNLYTSGICYRRGYKVKWWHSEGLYTLVTLYIGFVN